MVENPTMFEALEHILESSRGDTHLLLNWITAAWRHVLPSSDLTQFEASVKWNALQEAIQLARQPGVLYYIYSQVPTTLAASMLPQFRKILFKGAPQHLRMTLAGPLQGSQAVADTIDLLKAYRELDSEKVVISTH